MGLCFRFQVVELRVRISELSFEHNQAQRLEHTGLPRRYILQGYFDEVLIHLVQANTK